MAKEFLKDVKDAFRISDKAPKPPVNDRFRDRSPPSGVEKTNPSDAQWHGTQNESRNSVVCPVDTPNLQNPTWPDTQRALRESKQPQYLPSGNLGDYGSEKGNVRSMDTSPIDSHSLKPQSRASRSPERRSGKSKNKDPHREIKDLLRELKEMESKHKKTLKSIDESHAREGKRLKDHYTSDMQRMSKELKTAQQDIDKQTAEVSRLRQELYTVKTNVDRERRHMEADHAGKIDSMHHDMQVARNNAEQRERQMTQTHANEVRNLKQEIQNGRNNAEANEQRLRQDHEKTLNKLNETHATEICKQEEEHQQITRKQQHEIEELNEAWLNRDDEIYQSMLFTTSGLPTKPDDKIKSEVSKLQQMIDDLSRTEWKSSPEIWTDRVLQRIGSQHGQRSLKRAIIQDLIWSLLFQWIFCSPFRMFGEKGQELEREWNEQCGKERPSGDELYTWPPPGIKAERWRYMTIKECYEILTKPVPSHIDKRVEVKRGFKTNQEKLIRTLEDELDRVVQLKEHQEELLETLAKKAAVTWLDFVMHRCRIVIRLKGAGTKSSDEKVAAIHKGSTALTIVPTVGRYGNVKGLELGRFTVMTGYEGDTLDIA